MKGKLKSIGEMALGFLILCAFLTLFMLFFYGAAWVGEKVLPILTLISGISFLILVVIGTPLALFRKTRIITGQGWFYWSYLLGLILWLMCLIATLELWGVVAAVIGMMFLAWGFL